MGAFWSTWTSPEGDWQPGDRILVVWVPETVLTAIDLLLRRPSEPGMIRRCR